MELEELREIERTLVQVEYTRVLENKIVEWEEVSDVMQMWK